ncbi:hypothetical protein DUI87_04667 [Hirundo rustica rustica]|uniref:Coiled-coil domain-containing protein 93 n=1 Tax=Hirundo rustica rustica TaxID=333673 RepID=A0A3M0L186_HIRRU|nr:hypothetical protein DUI87_04667 [Hirundo rustica rustica]
MASSGSREQFLRQMEQIVEGIKQNRMKMEKKKQENKMRRDQLNDEYLELLEKQRLYFKTVKEFKELPVTTLDGWSSSILSGTHVMKFNEYCQWNNIVDESELSSTHHSLQATLDYGDVSK